MSHNVYYVKSILGLALVFALLWALRAYQGRRLTKPFTAQDRGIRDNG
jgi:hypothetical protein